MIKVYISGKITDLPIEEAKRLFKEAEERLVSMGFRVVNPIEAVPFNKDFKWHEYMIEDIKLIFDCQAMYMLSNWRDSKGARIEHSIGIETGHKMFYQDTDL